MQTPTPPAHAALLDAAHRRTHRRAAALALAQLPVLPPPFAPTAPPAEPHHAHPLAPPEHASHHREATPRKKRKTT